MTRIRLLFLLILATALNAGIAIAGDQPPDTDTPVCRPTTCPEGTVKRCSKTGTCWKRDTSRPSGWVYDHYRCLDARCDPVKAEDLPACEPRPKCGVSEAAACKQRGVCGDRSSGKAVRGQDCVRWACMARANQLPSALKKRNPGDVIRKNIPNQNTNTH